MKRFINKLFHGGGGTNLNAPVSVSKGCENQKIGYNGDEVYHNYNGDCMKKFFAFTLAELVIVMLIIAVVAGVSIKITKAKLDSVVSYTYYSAFNTLRSVAGEMMADSDASEEYGELSYNYKEKSLVDKLIDNYLVSPVSATSIRPGGLDFACADGFVMVNGKCQREFCAQKPCLVGYYFDTISCSCKKNASTTCPGTQVYDPVSKKCLEGPTCPMSKRNECMQSGGTFDLSTCICTPKAGCDIAEKNTCITEGGIWNNTACQCAMPVQACDANDVLSCQSSGGTWNGYPNCSCTPKAQECTLTQNDCSKKQVLDKEKCQCRDKKVTLPKTGKEFCEAFVSYTNTTTFSCNTQNKAEVTAAVNSGDFKNLAPDIVLRNGMKIYNAKNDYVKIDELSGNIPLVNNYETRPLMKNKVLFAGLTIKDKLVSFYNSIFKQPTFAYKNDRSLLDRFIDYLIPKSYAGINDPILYPDDIGDPLKPDVVCGPGYIKKCVSGYHNDGGCYCEKVNLNPVCLDGYYWSAILNKCTPGGELVCTNGMTPARCSLQGGTFYNCDCLKLSVCSDIDRNNCTASGGTYDNTNCVCTPKTPDPTPDPDPEPDPEPNPPVDGFDEEGLPNNLNEYGYIIYIDIDGPKGDSVLYEDVFPFYMTLEGRVVPAYKSGEEAGGNSASHLTVSVQYDVYNSGDRRENWMSPKGTDFQHAACMSGYVTANTYCAGVNDAQLASKRAICSQTSSDCRLKVNKPLRF